MLPRRISDDSIARSDIGTIRHCGDGNCGRGLPFNRRITQERIGGAELGDAGACSDNAKSVVAVVPGHRGQVHKVLILALRTFNDL